MPVMRLCVDFPTQSPTTEQGNPPREGTQSHRSGADDAEQRDSRQCFCRARISPFRPARRRYAR